MKKKKEILKESENLLKKDYIVGKNLEGKYKG